MLRNLKLPLLLIIATLAITISSCTAPSQEPSKNFDPYPFQNEDEASLGNGSQNPYPFQTLGESPPANSTPIPFEGIPTPSQTTSVISGFLMHPGPGAEPYIAELYLGRAIEAQQPGFEPLISFSRDTDASAIQDPQTGMFYFADVPPGKFALIVWNPINSYVFKTMDSDEILLIEVNEGELIDLGELMMP